MYKQGILTAKAFKGFIKTDEVKIIQAASKYKGKRDKFEMRFVLKPDFYIENHWVKAGLVMVTLIWVFLVTSIVPYRQPGPNKYLLN